MPYWRDKRSARRASHFRRTSMMWSKRYWVSGVLLFAVWMSPAVAQPHWISFSFGGGFSDAQAATLASWINDTCRPDEMGHIVGFSHQEAPGKPVNLQVYCRQGAGKLGKAKVVRSQFPDEFALEQRFFKPVTIESAAILGFDVTKSRGLPDLPTGTVVMVVRE
jgi:hypothetical protein